MYAREVAVFADTGDVGEVWFGEQVLERMADWLVNQHVPSPLPASWRALELGCGNGTLLVALAERGVPESMLHGVDYSSGALALARGVALRAGFPKLSFAQRDLANGVDSDAGTWPLVLDKGTFDAIALDTDRSLFHAFPRLVAKLLAPAGRFVITSCNFTHPELSALFAPALSPLALLEHDEISFGGGSGSAVTTAAFVAAAD